MNSYKINRFLAQALVAGMTLVRAGQATANNFSVLHTFAAFGNNVYDTNSGGGIPLGGLILSGNTLYGTASAGGDGGAGTVFAIDITDTNFLVVHPFTSINNPYGTNSDGAGPSADLAQSGDTLYGITQIGGLAGLGTVFAVNTSGLGAGGLYSFTNGIDGGGPRGVTLSGSTLYGTTVEGGAYQNGTIFAFNIGGSGFVPLHSFAALSGFPIPTNGEGAGPQAGLVVSGSTLYGTANSGGHFGDGTVFAMQTDGTGFTVLHHFSALSTQDLDGAMPLGALVLSGNTLYGTASRGGGNGTVFSVHTDGSGFTTLHNFSLLNMFNENNDGAIPSAGLALVGNTLYGTAGAGGPSGQGTVFSLPTDGSSFTLLHGFTGGSDGGAPLAGVTVSGNIVYGTTSTGADGNGTVFGVSTEAVNVAVGSLKVTIEPPGSVAAEAQWQVDGGTWQADAATVSNLSVGRHTVSFYMISGWNTPGDQTVTIRAGFVVHDTATYAFSGQGLYNGLFMQSNVTEQTAGMLSSLEVTETGTFSGRLLIDGQTNPITGEFDVAGQSSNYVRRANSRGGPLTLEMALNWNTFPPEITGSVSGSSDGAWTSDLTALVVANGLATGEYTMLLPPNGAPLASGYLLMTNDAGAARLTGALADGTTFSQAVRTSFGGRVPVFGNLYNRTGLLLGWIYSDNGSPAGTLTWIKPASHSALFPNGFTNVEGLQGAPWTNPPPHTAAIDLASGELNIVSAGLPSPLTFNVAVSNNNALVKLPGGPTNSLTGTINPKTGLLNVTFGNGHGRATTKGVAAVLQNVTNGAGFFWVGTNVGSITLQP
jgi:uncharacterized repeat protein (TIGR03803 family)